MVGAVQGDGEQLRLGAGRIYIVYISCGPLIWGERMHLSRLQRPISDGRKDTRSENTSSVTACRDQEPLLVFDVQRSTPSAQGPRHVWSSSDLRYHKLLLEGGHPAAPAGTDE